jgi:uncharacterized protein (DUF433 family)
MLVEDYLELNDPDGIRIKGHRIWMNDLLYEVIYNGLGPDGLLERFPSLTREKIYAALLYFERHRSELIQKLNEELARQERVWAEDAAENAALREKLLRRAAELSERAGA